MENKNENNISKTIFWILMKTLSIILKINKKYFLCLMKMICLMKLFSLILHDLLKDKISVILLMIKNYKIFY